MSSSASEMEKEQKTFSKFILDRTATKLSNGCTRQYYCHQLFNNRKTKEEIEKAREAKYIGTNKIDGPYPSMIKLTISEREGTVQIEFWENHYGHEKEIGRIGIDKDTKLNIAGILYK